MTRAPAELNILLTSVPHSGTRFFRELIQPDATWHVHDKRIGRGLERARIKVCAVRRPELVWRSWWWRRFGLKPDLSGPGDKWHLVWDRLAEHGRRHDDIHYLPIDLPSRESYLAALAEKLGRPLETDWQPLGEFWGRTPEEGKTDPPEIDLSWIYEIPVIRRFYG